MNIIELENFEISFLDKIGLGVLIFSWNSKDLSYFYSVHLLVRRSKRTNKKYLWGYEENWYDGTHKSFGCGPFFLIAWF